jgi:hypothetical protein
MLEIPLIGRGKSYSCLSANSDDAKSVSENTNGVKPLNANIVGRE